MKKFVLFILLALQTICFAEKMQADDFRITQFDSYLNEITEAYHIPGMAFFITDSEHTLFSKTYGQCNSMNNQFFIGSMSKSYTALCIMQLVEKGLVNLDADISTYLPDYKFAQKISVLSLLNHTSGFDTHMKFTDVKITDSYGKYEYANINYDLLGKIIEAVSGINYEEYVRENVFIPLGMSNSCANALKTKGNPKLLTGNRNYFGFFITGEADYPKEKSWFHEPAGFIASTPADHAEYLRMYLNGGITKQGLRIIKKETIDSMWYENVPLSPKEEAFYGKGWNYMNLDGLKVIFHGGQVENGIAYQFILPEKDLAVCFMINANDEFGMNSLMDNAFWNSLSIIKGESPKKVNHASYILIHSALNAIYLLIFLFSLFILIKAILKKKDGTSKNKAKSIILSLLGYLVFPLFLVTFTKIFFGTPLWVVKSYVPDLYCVIIVSLIFAITGGILKGTKLIFNK
ncbi:MAG: beta-lactamase family protein [Spirochaetaceae bacterium]|nr:beta-lactamase family protein [Spirochaetaceae bacterium]